jgi:hypothetical protein
MVSPGTPKPATPGRRFCTDLNEAHARAYLTKKLNGMMVWQFMESRC